MLLTVVGMTMYRARDPATWRWLGDDMREDGAKSETDSGKSEAKVGSSPDVSDDEKNLDGKFVETLVTGPNDLQPFEQSQADYIFQAITDKTKLAPEEMPAYWRLMRWSMTQSFDELKARARKDLFFTNFADIPDKLRGKPIRLKLSLRRVLKHDDLGKNSVGVKETYEAWGLTNESRSGLYVIVFYDKPPELPLGAEIHEEAEFVGYFLKLMGYEDYAVQRWAPLLIGRLRWRENPLRSSLKRQREEQKLWPWIIGGAGIVVLFVGLWTRNYLRAGQLPHAEGEVDHAKIEQWLETNTDSDDDGIASGNGWTEFVESVEEPRPESLPNLDRNSPDRGASDSRRV